MSLFCCTTLLFEWWMSVLRFEQSAGWFAGKNERNDVNASKEY